MAPRPIWWLTGIRRQYKDSMGLGPQVLEGQPFLAVFLRRLCYPLGGRNHDGLTPLTGEEMSEKLSDYLMTAEAAEFLGVSQNTLRAWAKQGKIAVQVNPVNNYRLFRRRDLQTFLDSVAKPVTRKPK